MKNKWLSVTLLFGVVMLFIQCEKDDDIQPLTVLEVDGNGHSRFNKNALKTVINNLPKEDLSDLEEAGIVFMREEEKLAHDVYVKLYEKWDNHVFDHIADSEQTHAGAVLLLLEKYELADPVGSNDIGVFVNMSLQQLYTELTALGLQSEIGALKVGAVIEEIDILDLDNQLENIVDNQDIEVIYTNLQKGSRNHLRAFVKNLDNRGIVYVPQYLSQEAYDEIISGSMESGR